jgi:DNA-binding protein Fis
MPAPAVMKLRIEAQRVARQALVDAHEKDVLLLVLDEARSGAVKAALDHCNGNQSAAARRLGIHRKTLLRYARRYGLRVKGG